MLNDTENFIDPGERVTIGKIFSFAVVLRAADLMPLDEDEYWERPWKWSTEYEAWTAAGKPWPPEDAMLPNLPDLGWRRFLHLVAEAIK